MIKKIKGIYNSSGTNRTAINTLLIYLQRFMTAGLSLITTPLILKALGVENFGIYTLTIGFVGMLSFLNWSLSSSTQRYIGHAIGAKNFDRLKTIFSTALVIHLIYGIALLVIIGIVGFFFVDEVLNIPQGKLNETKQVMLAVGGITFITIVSIPFLGVLRAKENFTAISVIGVTESLLKLVIAVLLVFIAGGDKLILYSVLLLTITAIVFILYFIIVSKKYKEISISLSHYDGLLVKEMMSFFSWSLFGAIAIMSRNQGVQVLINIFFGVVKNAAYGIAMQINAAMAILSQGVLGSISPQIVKSAGAGDTKRMIYLMRTMSKFAIFSVSIAAIPLFFQCATILDLWLDEVPNGSVIYVQLIIIFTLVQLLSAGIQTVFDALGKVKLYNIWVSFILILNLPVSYIMFKLGYPSYTIIIVGMALELTSLIVRLILLKKYVELSLNAFFYDTVFRIILPTAITAFAVYLVTIAGLNRFAELVLSFAVTMLVYPVLIYNFSLEGNQKALLSGMLAKVIPLKKK
jgi:O-antigen/teichoic acid export membrane protein